MTGAHKRNTTRMLSSPRCGARTRLGLACRSPAVSGKKRCRMHGGAKGSGAPKANQNALKHGAYTKRAVLRRTELRKSHSGRQQVAEGAFLVAIRLPSTSFRCSRSEEEEQSQHCKGMRWMQQNREVQAVGKSRLSVWRRFNFCRQSSHCLPATACSIATESHSPFFKAKERASWTR